MDEGSGPGPRVEASRRWRVALATWGRAHPQSDRELALLREGLAEAGVLAEPVVWTAGRDLSEFDACVIHSTWDFPERLEEFQRWVAGADRATRLWNPARHVRWNLHKGYLLELSREHGVAIPPTRLLGRGKDVDLASLLDETGWARAVVKPAVGATAVGLFDVARSDAPGRQRDLDDLLGRGDVLVQEFLPSVGEVGEVSLFAFEGVPAHAVRKRPRAGDFRVQSEYGGTNEPTLARRDERELAAKALASLPETLLYARVDVVRLPDGRPALMEFEAIEPYLFFRSRDQARPYLDAIVRRLEASPEGGA